MSDETLIAVPPAAAQHALIDDAGYRRMYEQSVRDPEGFWAVHAKRLDWMKPFTKVKDTSFKDNVHIRWFWDGTLNACVNCVDRHLAKRGDQTAIIWEGDDP